MDYRIKIVKKYLEDVPIPEAVESAYNEVIKELDTDD